MMSNELDEAWITICHYNEEIIHDMGSEYVENPLKEEIDIVNNALLELKAIKEANPSEALKKLDDISYLVLNEIDDLKNKELWKSYFNTIKQALLKELDLEKENKTLKACISDWEDNYEHLQFALHKEKAILKIIKEKPYESAPTINYIKINKGNHKMLNYKHYCMTVKDKVNENEFDLLMRYFNE